MPPLNQAVAIFFLAHQDDEYGVYRQIADELVRGRRVVCAYLTSGAPAGGDPILRNRESLAVLSRLGVPAQDVVFAGAALQIADGSLVEALPLAADWIKSSLISFDNIAAVYIAAWEGGHPDHDALHAVTVQICHELQLERRAWQFPLYNAHGCPWKFFRVLSPLSQNGPITRLQIPWRKRPTFLRFALSYPTQRITWIGLFPFFLIHYVFSGCQQLQPVSRSRIEERPHLGDLYYEKRGFSTWEKTNLRIANWLATREASTANSAD